MELKELDTQLKDAVKHVVIDKSTDDMKSVLDLLEQGADPKAGEAPTSYDLVKENNESGAFNVIIEKFDEHIEGIPREMDSVDEGMPLTSDEK